MKPRVILVVEDDVADVELARVALADADVTHEMEAVTDGSVVLPRLRRQAPYQDSALPSLIFLDLSLPQQQGIDLLAEIKTDPELRCVPVVVFSANEDPEVLRQVYKRHANAFIHKPVDLSSFTRTLRSSAEYWLGLVSQPEPHS